MCNTNIIFTTLTYRLYIYEFFKFIPLLRILLPRYNECDVVVHVRR